jgi:hypothetical protein
MSVPSQTIPCFQSIPLLEIIGPYSQPILPIKDLKRKYSSKEFNNYNRGLMDLTSFLQIYIHTELFDV